MGLGCGDNAIAPKPGNAIVSFTTPDADDGVVLLALFGPGFADIQPANGSYRVYSLAASPTEVHVLVVGDLAAGALLTVNVDDPGRLAEYHGTVVEVASRSDEVRTVVPGYDVTFAAH
jgi:hypothetical protein